MINVKKEGIILRKSELEFENEGVLNPAVILEDGKIHLFYRAVRKGNHSSIGYCLLEAPLHLAKRNQSPVIFPQTNLESRGTEDPRIVHIEDTYYLTYTAYDGVNALGALALSKDLIHFEKWGVLTPKITYEKFEFQAGLNGRLNEKYLRYNEHERIRHKEGTEVYLWNKDVIFFPRRINGKLVFMQRIRPDIQIVSVNALEELVQEFWDDYFLHFDEQIMLAPKHSHEVSYIGGGCPPIETVYGWLLIYHGVHDTVKGFVYSACAALLDLDDPRIEIARLPYALFKPELPWELKGEVNNVCFPTGTVVVEDTLYIYYGAADEQIACASLSLSGLLNELLLNVKKPKI